MADNELTGKLRDFRTQKPGHKPATTLIQNQERIVGDQSESVHIWSYMPFNLDGTPGEPQTFFADTGQPAYYSDREVDGVTIPANARHPEKATEARKPFAPSSRTYELTAEGHASLVRAGYDIPESKIGSSIQVDQQRPSVAGEKSFDIIRIGALTIDSRNLPKSVDNPNGLTQEELATLYEEIETVGKDAAEVSRLEAKDVRKYEGALLSLPDYLSQDIVDRPVENALDYGIDGFTYQGTTLNDAAQDKVKDYFRNIYDNIIGTIKVGMGVRDVKDLSEKFAEQFYRTPIDRILTREEITGVGETAIPLEVAPTTVKSVVSDVNYHPYSRDFAVVSEDYRNMREDFVINAGSENPRTAWDLLGSGYPTAPMPYNARLASNPVGRIMTMANYAPHIWSNVATQSASRNFEERQSAREAILNRTLAELIAADPGVVSGQEDLNDRYKALMDELGRRKENRMTLINSPISREIKTSTVNTVKMLEIVNDLESTLLRINPTGFLTGTPLAFLTKAGITDLPWTESFEILLSGESKLGIPAKEVAALYKKFLAQTDILNELGGRDLLRTTGDLRYSDKDMEGARKVLMKLGQTGGMNLARMQELKGYLLNGLNANMNGLGTLDLQDDLVIRAIKVGAKVSGVRPSRKGAYSPFAPEPYAVSQNKQPGYNRNDIEQWRLEGTLAPTMKGDQYFLPSEHGMAPGVKDVLIPKDQMFALKENGSYKNLKYIEYYMYWLGELEKAHAAGTE
jgi:hypothetical protein